MQRRMIGAGAWTDDLDSSERASLLLLASIGGGILLVVLLAAWLIDRDICGSLGEVKAAMEDLSIPGISTEVKERAMAHTPALMAVCDQHAYRNEKLALYTAWEQRLAVIVNPPSETNVVALKPKIARRPIAKPAALQRRGIAP